jgi:integrase-like protein
MDFDVVRSVPVHRYTWTRPEPLCGPGEGPVLRTATGRPLDRRAAARTLCRVAATAGIPGRFSPHLLRHTFVTLARQSGCPLQDVQDAVGHADRPPPAATSGRSSGMPLIRRTGSSPPSTRPEYASVLAGLRSPWSDFLHWRYERGFIGERSPRRSRAVPGKPHSARFV